MIKHSSSFTHSDFTPDFTSLSALPNMVAEHFLSVKLWLLRKHVRRQGSAFTAYTYGTASKIFGLETETLVSDCERHRLKRFLLNLFALVSWDCVTRR